MKLRIACVIVGFLSLVLSLTPLTVAQTSAQTASALPRLVRFGGTVKDFNGNPLAGVVGITFALYSEQTGGAPLWLETQNVSADSNGRYTALLGSTKPDGLPTDLFTSEQARWVGVQVSGQAEQPRVLLLSVPYSLKAADAETLGGLPASAFMQANSSVVAPKAGSRTNSSTAGSPPVSAVTGSGTKNFIPVWTGAATLGNSVIYETGGKVGVGTKTPGAEADSVSTGIAVRGTSSGTTGTGVEGEATSSSGINYGVFGQTASPTGIGVVGANTATSGRALGIQGSTTSPGGFGVVGIGNTPGGAEYWATTPSPAVGDSVSAARAPARQVLAWLARTQPPQAKRLGFRARL